MITDPIAFLQLFKPELIMKIFLLIFIGLFAVFAFMIFNQVRSFNRIVFFPSSRISGLLKMIALIYFLTVVSLFFLTLAIV